MKKELLEKLKSYSKTAAALAVVGGTANAQIVYTDANPDTTLNVFPSNYEIDFDGDGSIDINMSMATSNGNYGIIKAIPVGTNTSVVSTNSYVAVLGTADLISPSNAFVNSGYYIALISATSGGSTWGNWGSNIDDKYVGVKFDISGLPHYGWIRVSTTYNAWDNMSVTIKDFAYQSIVDSAIYAGSVQADTTFAVVASDVADNGNGLDLQVDFNMANEEMFIAEYRVMVVKSADATTFDIDSANAVIAANYLAVTPTGSNVSTVFTAGSTDINGDAIVNDIPYKLFVLSVTPDSVLSVNNINSLSSVSNEITLTAIAIIPADTAFSIVASDIADNGNGLDLQVDFTKASDETTVSEYRVMVVNSADATMFDLTAAESVVAANYTSITPTGNNISAVLTATSNDVNGNAIVNDTPYKLFVLSIADGTNATINGLSSESNEVILVDTTTNIVDINLTTNIYPNPVSNVLNIELKQSDNYTVKLTDILGQEFILKEFNGNYIALDVNNLEKGNYILTISNEKTVSTKQIIIQ